METAAIAILVAVCFLFVGRSMLRNLGIGTPAGKPDCGCGRCAEKKRRKR